MGCGEIVNKKVRFSPWKLLLNSRLARPDSYLSGLETFPMWWFNRERITDVGGPDPHRIDIPENRDITLRKTFIFDVLGQDAIRCFG